jgi:hypothetical protein
MLSLQVASERADLSGVEARIVRTKQAIRDLQTELGTRGRLSQLENWNAEVLALSAPVAGQFVENEVMLARLETPTGELGDAAQVRMASAESAPSAPEALPRPQIRTADAAVPSAPAKPLLRRASLATVPAAAPARPAAAPARSQARPAVTQARAEPLAAIARTPAPVRAAALLDERTTRQINETARAESRPRRATPAAATSAAIGGERSGSRPARAVDKN